MSLAVLVLLLAACRTDSDGKPADTDPTDPGADTDVDTEPDTDTTVPVVPLVLEAAIAARDPLAAEVTVTLDRPATVEVACTSPDDPAEEIVVTSAVDGAAPGTPIRVDGLLADTRYTCVVTATDGPAVATWAGDVTSGSVPVGFPEWTVTPGADASGYVLFNTMARAPKTPADQKWILVDPDGRIRWYRELLGPGEGGTNIGVELAWVPERRAILACGGDEIEPAFYALDGMITAVAPATDFETSYHHDCQLLPDGNILGMRNSRVVQSGVEVAGTDLVMVRPDGTEAWRWSLQVAIDAGAVTEYSADQLDADSDPWHANAVAFLPDDGAGPAVWLSLKADDRLLRIAWPSGEVTRWVGAGGAERLEDAAGEPRPPAYWFYSQHGPDYRLEADGLHILLYDNGSGRPGANTSRALEIVDAGGVWREVLSFDDGGVPWYTPLWGDADWLADGRDLIMKPHCWDCVGVPDMRTEILVHDRTGAREDWRLLFTEATDTGYRAQWIDGCDIFGNLRYCP